MQITLKTYLVKYRLSVQREATESNRPSQQSGCVLLYILKMGKGAQSSFVRNEYIYSEKHILKAS